MPGAAQRHVMRPIQALSLIGLLASLVAPTLCLARAPSSRASGTAAPAAIVRALPADRAWQNDVRRRARHLVDAGFVAGMSVAVTRGDRVIYVDSFGVADGGSGRRVDGHTRFYIASTTKALTATAVLQEASRGT